MASEGWWWRRKKKEEGGGLREVDAEVIGIVTEAAWEEGLAFSKL